MLNLFPLLSQNLSEEETTCITPSLDSEFRRQNPILPSRTHFENWLQEKMAHSPERSGIREVLTIPVVVHIIHNGEAVGTGSNISVEQVQSQMRVLEEDFRKLAGTPGDNDNPVGVDTEIEFCLAYIGNDGKVLTESGIDRIDRNEAGFSAPPYSSSYINSTIKAQTIWDVTQYMNIWVVGEISPREVAGFATLPEAPPGLDGLPNHGFPGIDGLVVVSRFFGRQGFSTGRTTTHEIGHWLGLLHVSGPFNAATGQNSCITDDFCSDTPNMDGTNQGCSPSISCDSSDPLDNQMIGTLGNCRKTLTACQRDRMQTVMQNSPRRVELLSSTVCQRPTIAPTAGFVVDNPETCDGRVRFLDTSTDLATEWFWLFGNGTSSEERNPVIQYEVSGTYTITLIVTNELGVSQISKEVEITVSGGTIDAGEDITACFGDEVQLNGTSSIEEGRVLWFPTTGLSDPYILNPTLIAGTGRIYILSIALDNGCDLRDTLEVLASPKPTTLILPTQDITIDKGQSFQLNAIGAESYLWSPTTGLSDPNIPNPLASPEETTLYTVLGSNEAGCSQTDNILVTVNNPVNIREGLWAAVGQVYPPFPNPAFSQLSFSADLAISGRLKIRLLDIYGKEVVSIYKQQVSSGNFFYEWNRTSRISAGFYLAEWELTGRRFTQKVQLK